MPDDARTTGTDRVASHRRKAKAGGARRIEVTVPAEDGPRLRRLAGVLRAGGPEGVKVRAGIDGLVGTPPAHTGANIVDFLRASPLAARGEEIAQAVNAVRDRSTGRSVDFD